MVWEEEVVMASLVVFLTLFRRTGRQDGPCGPPYTPVVGAELERHRPAATVTGFGYREQAILYICVFLSYDLTDMFIMLQS